MKILLVNYEYKPQCGGAGLGIYNMAKTFSEMGHEVSILIGWDYKYGEPEIIENVNTYVVKTKKKNIHQSTPQGLLEFVLKGYKKINKLTRTETFDIIQFYFSVPTGILKYGIKRDVPYVVSLRGMDIPGFRDDKYKSLSVLTNCLNRMITKSAVAVTSLSDEAANYYRKFSPMTEITTIPNAVDYERYKPKRQYENKVRKFVSVSRLTGFKKLDLMIEAFADVHERYDDIILDIYGEGKERGNLERLISELNAEKYIHLRGYADQKQLVNILPGYDCFSLMSVGDSFGVVFIEAMAAGLPVLCAKAGGPIEIIVEGKTGVFAKANDLGDTIEKLEYCINHPSELEQMGKNGRKRVVQFYSKKSVAEQHIKLYESCLHTLNKQNN